MDIKAICDAIEELENSDTTADNVQELSALYIVKEHLEPSKNKLESEFNDILPAYYLYIEEKRQYQLGKMSESAVIQRFSEVCNELKEFLLLLYSGTDTWKERKKFKILLEEVIKKCSQTR